MSNLLEKASIIHVPAGYDVGSINAVKPNPKVIDTELLTNNSFDTTGNWNTSNDKWVVAGDGYAVYDSDTTSGDANLTQTNVMVIGKTYRVKIVIDSFDNGGSNGFLGLRNPTSTTVEQMSSAGTYYFDIKALATTFAVRAVYNSSTTLKISISEISLKQISSGDLNFERNTVATRINSASIVEEEPVDVPRIDYNGGVGHWLMESGSINTATYSNDFTQGTILGTSANIGTENAIVTADQATSPDGNVNATKMLATGGGGRHGVQWSSSDIISATNYTISVFAKKGENIDWFMLGAYGYDTDIKAWFNLSIGEKGTLQNGVSSQIEDYGNGWYRCSLTFNSTTDIVGSIRILLAKSDASDSFAISPNEYHYIYGVQVEQLSFPTSYIPTNGSTVTRASEIATNSGDETLFGQTEGVLYAEIAAFDTASADRVVEVSNGSSSSNLRINFRSNGNFQIRGAMSSNLIIDYTATAYNANQFYKVALKYKSGENAAWIDGVEVFPTTNTYTPIDTIDVLNLQAFNGNVPFYGKVKCIAIFPEALTDAELECLTTTSTNQILGEYKIYVERTGGVSENESAVESTLNELT